MACEDCNAECVSCEEFEALISEETEQERLVAIRKGLILHRVVADTSLQGKIADWLTAKVGTMGCIIAFALLVMLPFVFPKTLNMVQFIGGTFIPLLLMPLFLLAANRTDAIREQRAEREHRIQLVYDRIEEIKGDRG